MSEAWLLIRVAIMGYLMYAMGALVSVNIILWVTSLGVLIYRQGGLLLKIEDLR